MKKIGPYLKEVRERHNLTLRAVEEKTGISNAYLSQLENCKISNPSPLILQKLADCYKIPYERLMELVGYPLPAKSVSEKEKLQPTFRLSSGFEDLTEKEKEDVMEYIQFLKSRRIKG
jgi:transcriptional regulator with XRE-family HTH domain